MKITASRIKEIIREEYSRMNEASRHEEADIITVPGVGPQGLRRSLDNGGGMQLADDEVRAAFAKALGEAPGGVYAMGPGAGFQALVEFDDGRLVKVKLGGGFTGDSGSEDVDAAIYQRRGDKPMVGNLEESRETLKQFGKMAKGPKGKITARQAREMGLGDKLDDETAAAAVRKDFGIDEEAEDAPKDTERVIDDIEDTSKFVDLPKEFTALVSYIAKSVAPQVDNALKAKYFEELARSLRKLDTAEEEIPT